MTWQRGFSLALAFIVFPLLAEAYQRPSNPKSPEEIELERMLNTSFTILGRVIESRTQRFLPSVSVTLRTTRGPTVNSTFTNDDGSFEFQGLEEGRYVLEVKAEGYKRVEQDVHLYFDSGRRRIIEILLQPEAGTADAESPNDHLVSIRELNIPPEARAEFEEGLRDLNERELPAESEEHFRKAIELYADYDEAYNQLGLAHLYQDEQEEAQEVLENAIAVNEQNARAHALLGILFRSKEKYEDSVRCLTRATELIDSDSASHMELAKSLLALRRDEEAKLHAERSHALNPGSPDIHLVLYSALVRLQMYERALGELDEFLAKFPSHSRANEVQAQKKQLEAFMLARKQEVPK